MVMASVLDNLKPLSPLVIDGQIVYQVGRRSELQPMYRGTTLRYTYTQIRRLVEEAALRGTQDEIYASLLKKFMGNNPLRDPH